MLTTTTSSGELESFATSIPQEKGFYWYWQPHSKVYVIAEAVERNGKMILIIGNFVQGFLMIVVTSIHILNSPGKALLQITMTN